MAVPFMPDQREGDGKLFCLRLIDGNGQTDQITLVELIVVMAVVRRSGNVVVIRLGRHKHRLFKTGQTHGDVTLPTHLSQHLVERLCVAAFPEDADMRIAQKRLQIHASWSAV